MNKPRPIVKSPAGPDLSAKDLRDFEQRWQFRLPPDYAAWLLCANGGAPISSVISGATEEVFIQFLFPLDPRGEKGLDSEMRRMRLHPGLLPVAQEGTGGIVCMSVTDGKLVLLEDPADEDAEISPVANGWAAFAAMLAGQDSKPIPEEHPFVRMVRNTDIEALDAFIAKGGDIEATSPSGETLLQLAVLKSNKPMLEALVGRGASLKGGLHEATLMSNVPMLKWLAEHGADFNERNMNGQLPEDKASPYIRRMVEEMRRQRMQS